MVTAGGDRRDLMSEWPEGWFRGEQNAGDAGAAGPSQADLSSNKTAGIPAHPGGQYQVPGWAGQDAAGGSASGRAQRSAWPDQPPLDSNGFGGVAAPSRRGSPPRWPGAPTGWRRWARPRRIFAVLGVVIALLVAGTVGTYFYLNSKLNRQNILVDFPQRPAVGSGTNWLIAGSDSRQGLTRKQEHRLHTGIASGGRSDTIMILHVPANGGKPLLISLPRDSYVNIPGHGYNKLNAAYAYGGPTLLAKTVQVNTHLYISHFMDIGFGGFVRVVDAVGGVRMCLKQPMHDRASGVHLSRGCHDLSGGQALAYVRDRHQFATQDLQREQDQRLFMHALLTKMTSAGVMFNPFASIPAANGAVSALTVDQSTSLYQLVQVARALPNAQTTTVPIANAGYVTPVGDAVLWNSTQAKQLFNDLNAGRAVPKSLITGSHQG